MKIHILNIKVKSNNISKAAQLATKDSYAVSELRFNDHWHTKLYDLQKIKT